MFGQQLKVLMTADAVGGVWSYAAGLCRSLPEIRFVLATMGPRPRQTQREEIHRLGNVTLVESDFSLEWMVDGGADLADSCAWLLDIVRGHHIDVVHVNGYAHARLGIDRAVLVVAHSDVLSWWAAVQKRRAPPEWAPYRSRVVAGLAAATRVVAPTAAVLRDLARHYPTLGGNGEVIANGIDFDAFPPLPKRSVVLSGGRLWDAAKNLATLDAIAPQLAWPVEIAGDTEHPDGGVPEFPNVRLLGRLGPAQMARHLGSASIFAAPARYEPFGLGILEAAAAGCALVLGDIPSLRESWDGAAAFVPPEDRVALAGTISALIADGRERTRLAAAARRRARRFTLHRMAQSYAALYCDVAHSSILLESV
jgi:glycogen(starch) synthase